MERFGWSSYGEYLKPASRRTAWLRVDRLLGEKGIPKDSAAGRKHFARLMERRETPMSLKWIAQRLRMGSWTYVFNLLNQKTKTTGFCN